MSEAAPLRLSRRFRESPYADYHEIVGAPELFAKVAPPVRVKRYPLGLTVRYPLGLYTAVKFGIRDVIRFEHKLFDRLPRELDEYLPRQRTLRQTVCGRTALCALRPRNFDGTFARMIIETGPVDNTAFHEAVEHIVEVLRRHRNCLLGVFSSGGGSVLVQKPSPDEWKPVITDVFKLGWRMYYYQPSLLLGRAAWSKFDRGLRRFKECYLRRSQPCRRAGRAPSSVAHG